MSEFNVKISANADDGYSQTEGSGFNNSLDYLIFGNASGIKGRSFFRFAAVAIPKDAIVSSAVLRFHSYGTGPNNTLRTNIRIEVAAGPTVPTAPSSGADLIGRSLGSSFTWDGEQIWSPDGTYDTDNFSAILETHLARAGWASGQALTVHIIDDSSSNNTHRDPKSRDYTSTLCAELRVTYTLVDDASDEFTSSDEIIAAGGYTEHLAWDQLSIADQIKAGFEIQAEAPDALTIDDEITVGFEYQGPAQDVFNISDLTDAFLWSVWLRENYGKYATRYFFTLTGGPDNESDLEIKFSSFQATKRNGTATYASVIIPGFEYSSAITARSNGDLKIDMAYLIDGVESLRENIIDVSLETIRTDEGARRRSISLSGSRTIDYKGNLITLENPIYKNISEGKIRYRFLQADPWLNPGDTVRCRSDEFVVDYITYTISERFRQMEVRET